MNSILPASGRLALSRERLRRAMQAETDRASAVAVTNTSAWSWLHGVMSAPGIGVVIEAVRQWWARHPLHVAGRAASTAAQVIVQPLAQRHPVGLMLGAAVIGGLVVLLRPWRWLFKPALSAGLLPQLFRTAAASVPAGTWTTALLSQLLQPPPPHTEPQQPGATVQPAASTPPIDPANVATAPG